MITGIIKGQTIKIGESVIVADTIDYLQASFAFLTNDWNGLEKWAHFTQGEKSYKVRLKNDRIERDSHLNLSKGIWKLYLHGNGPNGMRITTYEVEIDVRPTGALEGEVFPEIPLSVAEQIALDARQAREAAFSVREDAESGKFNGKNGIDGNGIESITKYETHEGGDGRVYNSYSINYTNGKKYIFTVTDGKDGDKIEQIESYRPDTGTIEISVVLTDGTRHTFTVNDGITPHIGENGNWWIGADDTGVKAKGEDYILTDKDKSEIAKMVLDNLPDGDEVSY